MAHTAWLVLVPGLQLPILIGCVFGLVKLARSRGRLPARSIALARTGRILVTADKLMSIAWSYCEPTLWSRSYKAGDDNFWLLNDAVNLVLALLLGAGFILLVAGLLAARSAAPPQSYATPAAYPPQQSYPQASYPQTADPQASYPQTSYPQTTFPAPQQSAPTYQPPQQTPYPPTSYPPAGG